MSDQAALPDPSQGQSDQKRHWAWSNPAVIAAVVAVAATLVVAVLRQFGIAIPSLFGADQGILAAAVIIGLSIIGAAAFAVGLGFLLRGRQTLSIADQNLILAESQHREAEARLDTVWGLLNQLEQAGDRTAAKNQKSNQEPPG